MEWMINFLERYQILNYAQALFILIIGIMLSKLISKIVHHYFKEKIEAQSALIIKKLLFYILVIVTVFTTLDHIGINLKVLLGAAGVFTVALGFASQTSASNLISGIFLLLEKPFAIGDTISIGDTTGIVLSVDLFSTRLRTFDNLFVRIPNETLMKGQIINFTHFPIRRIDIALSVAYGEDMSKISRILLKLSEENPLCLDEPEAIILVKRFAEYAIDVQFSVWGKKENYLKIKNEIHQAVIERFTLEGIKIPFPHNVTILRKD